MEHIDEFLRGAIWIIGILVFYQIIFRVIGFLFKAKKFKKTDKRYRYAILIAARNEEKVIAQLIDSIKKQDYPAELIKVFVVADNCTDSTAKTARDAGAVVYERINPPIKQQRKGCALDFLIKNIKNDYRIESFDGYFIFDADNLLASNYISEMNNAFDDQRFDFFNSYINVKNFGTSFIASFSSMTLYSNTCNITRPMSLLGLTQRKRGTGCLMRNHFLADGYPWNSMVEDNEFSANAIAHGYRSVCCEAAEFFDEQPQTFRMVMRQRMRWAKGKFIIWFLCMPRLLFGLFFPYDFKKSKKEIKSPKRPKQGFIKRGLEEIQKRFSVYDMFFSLAPTAILTFIYGFIYPIAAVVYKLFVPTYNLEAMLVTLVIYYATVYITSIVSNIFTLIREHRRMRINPLLLFVYLFFWPIIAIIIEYASLWALITPTRWKPIPHYENKEIENIYEDKTLAERLYRK